MWSSFDDLPILIAQDSADDLALLKSALAKEGMKNPQVATTTGEKTIAHLKYALELYPEDSFPGLLFLDLLMPKGGGMPVLHWLRNHPHPPIAIVLHTGVEDETLLAAARELGANYYLPKGVSPEALHEVYTRAQAEWEQHQFAAH